MSNNSGNANAIQGGTRGDFRNNSGFRTSSPGMASFQGSYSGSAVGSKEMPMASRLQAETRGSGKVSTTAKSNSKVLVSAQRNNLFGNAHVRESFTPAGVNKGKYTSVGGNSALRQSQGSGTRHMRQSSSYQQLQSSAEQLAYESILKSH